ncbi:MAG TPA: LysM peptidoglycan-binding domain-containing protein [Gaiellales bacterium]|nr:LysM peptidoglycan-binding domain-containing protein [Gaiellales bacterium]
MFASIPLPRLTAALAAAVCALALMLGFVSPSTGAATPTSYRVKPGDTLWSIAAAHGSGGDVRAAVYAIRSANHLSGATIVPGQTLMLP